MMQRDGLGFGSFFEVTGRKRHSDTEEKDIQTQSVKKLNRPTSNIESLLPFHRPGRKRTIT